MKQQVHDGQAVLAEAENVLAEVLLVCGVAAVGLFLTLLASGVTGWAAISGGAAAAMSMMAALSLRAGQHAAQRSHAPLGSDSVAGSMRVDSDSVVVEIPTQSVPMVFPVTTASIDGVVHSVVIGEYGPLGGVSPDGRILRTAVLDRWPDVRVFERRSTGERGADPRGYESFYVELAPSGCRTDIDLDEVSALLAVDRNRPQNADWTALQPIASWRLRRDRRPRDRKIT